MAEVEIIKRVNFQSCYVTVNSSDFRVPIPLHAYTFHGSGCETEYVWGTSLKVPLNPAYLYHSSTLAEVENTNSVKYRNRVYKRPFEKRRCVFVCVCVNCSVSV